MTSDATTTRLGPASPAQIERAREAAEMWRLADLLPPDLRAAFVRANAVLNMVGGYRSALLSPDPEMAKLRETAIERIDAAWEALAGHGVEEWNRVKIMRAVDVASQAASGDADAVLAELPPELVALLEPHRETLGPLVHAWRRRAPGRARKSKYVALAELWKAATGTETTPESWKTLWKDVASPEAVERRRLARIGSR